MGADVIVQFVYGDVRFDDCYDADWPYQISAQSAVLDYRRFVFDGWAVEVHYAQHLQWIDMVYIANIAGHYE